jgi:hypothetical protein
VNGIKGSVAPSDPLNVAITFRRPCRCGHERDQHEHYRRGTDCSGCACAAFHGQLEVTVRFGRPAPLPTVVVPDEVPELSPPAVRPAHSAGLPGAAAPSRVVAPRRPAEAASLHTENAG